MAVAPVSAFLPPLRGADTLPFRLPTVAAGGQPAALFSQAIESALSTGTPLPPAAVAGNLPGVPAASVLDQAYLRDLVSGIASADAARIAPAVTAGTGIEGLLGRNGLPDLLRQLADGQAGGLVAAATSFYDTLQALGDEDDTGPQLGALLDITA